MSIDLSKKNIFNIPKDTDSNFAITDLENVYAYDNKKPTLQGSASRKIFKYFGDYDFNLPNLKRPDEPKIMFKNFINIFDKIIKTNSIYFIEMKIQYLDGTKKKIYPKEDLTLSEFSKKYNSIDFIKIDTVIYSNQDFIESSCIYRFVSKQNKKINIVEDSNKSMINDLSEYKKEGEYFKMLKRYYSIFVNMKHPPENILYFLVNILNSKYGEMYSQMTRIQAYLLVDKYYNDEITNNRKYIFKNKIIGIPEKIISKYSKEINDYAKPFIPKLQKALIENSP